MIGTTIGKLTFKASYSPAAAAVVVVAIVVVVCCGLSQCSDHTVSVSFFWGVNLLVFFLVLVFYLVLVLVLQHLLALLF